MGWLAVWGPSADEVYVAGATVQRTVDHGRTWEEVPIPLEGGARGLVGRRSGLWVADATGVFAWGPGVSTLTPLADVRALDEGTDRRLFAVTADRKAWVSADGARWDRFDLPPGLFVTGVTGEWAWGSIADWDNEAVVAALFRHHDAEGWVRVPVPQTLRSAGIEVVAVDGDRVLVGGWQRTGHGASALLERSVDGGKTWEAPVWESPVDATAPCSWRDAWTNGSRAVVVGGSECPAPLLVSRDGGASFEPALPATVRTLSAIWATPSGDLLVAVGPGRVLWSQDCGESWTDRSPPGS